MLTGFGATLVIVILFLARLVIPAAILLWAGTRWNRRLAME
jgi:hypothetical protein